MKNFFIALRILRSCSAWSCKEFVMKNFFTVFSDNRSSLLIQHCPNLCMSVLSLFSDSCLNRPPSLTDHFGLSDQKKLTLSTFQVSDVTGKLIIIASHLNRLPCAIDHNCKILRKLVVVDVRDVGEGSCIVQGVLEVDIAGGREVQLIGVCELHVLGLITCDGCDIVQSDHAPEAGVAQGIFHGDLIRHQGGHQEELGEELEEEVERRVKREHSSNQTQVRMHG